MLRSPQSRATGIWRFHRDPRAMPGGAYDTVRHDANARGDGGIQTGPSEELSSGKVVNGAPPAHDAASPVVGVVPHG